MKQTNGYYRHPTISKNQIVFVSEDDLWTVNTSGGVGVRLTAGVGFASSPSISEDGRLIAFMGSEEGSPEVYVMPAEGGSSRRLTYLSSNSRVLGWKDGEILFYSNHGQPFRQDFYLYTISPEGGEPQRLPYGMATAISFGKKGVVLGRKAMEPATWKRYRGGTAGELWVDKTGRGNFKRLFELKGNFTSPMWIGERIYFISDHEGVGNIYSVNPDGNDIRKHTKQKEYYARNAKTDGKKIVYHAGADIYCYDLKAKEDKKIKIVYNSPFVQRQRKFVPAVKYLESCDVHPDGSRLALGCRGKLYNMANWEGGVIQSGQADGVRYRLSCWLNDGKRIVTVSDEGGEEHLEIYTADKNEKRKSINLKDTGRFMSLDVSPDKKNDHILFSNHRNELFWFDLKSGKAELIARNKYGETGSASWSPDGKWIAYSSNISRTTRVIYLYSLDKNESYQVTRPVLSDYDPCFSPDGKYLYLISYRILNPVYDSLHFDLGFPRGSLPYVIPLAKETRPPFDLEPKGFGNSGEKEEKQGKKGKDKGEFKVKVDLAGIEERIVPFPVEEANYYAISAAGKRIFYVVNPISGVLDDGNWMERTPKLILKYYDLDKQKEETMMSGISGFRLSRDGSALVIFQKQKLRVISSLADPANLSKEHGYNRETGWVDLNRIRISVNPSAEWKQMYAEAWRLQRDYFWVEDMSGIDWKKIYKRYYLLLGRIATRGEFSDLVWEMQGELGTSHAYEFGGDYRKSPYYQIGMLGADFRYDTSKGCYLIEHIVNGDVWDHKNPPPLKKPGLNITTGMQLRAVNGQKLRKEFTPEQALVNFAGQEVQLTVADKNGRNERIVTVKTLRSDSQLRYREWVEKNREYVHKKTKGKVGYVHIPDMMGVGYAEFHRYFLTEYDRDALIVDVRYNGGGHVSQLLLEKLARKRIGFDLTRWYDYEPYPDLSVKGPIVALTNEFAGSDGDIFSHSFKLMKLGKLIGKRTWGGVIGISPRNRLVDGGMTTQPEFSFWFRDVGWGVENYGTDPDIDVDIKPQDYVAGKDPQLDRGLEVILKEMKKYPYLKPDFRNRPKRTLP